ncbi:MAG: hypothetical protein R3342_07175 [Lutibacter sp.]|uniref:DUF7793 family protein n=1 Tax=Lutibacter sp. TaxID=1925666 RepID=UPI00299DF703|nr:hypothetical protein [Lutibacter sp.]MDX1829311.1 hypothetical protein [Lutibacter sp.]
MNYELFENEYAKFWVNNQILFFEYKPDLVIDLKAAQQIVKDRITFQNEVTYPIFCDIRGVVYFNKASRDYLAKSGSILTKAVGILVHQKVSKAISSFYLEISKPTVPTKLFEDKSKALQFLSNYI